MISWINGELVELWQTNQKFFLLINCQGLGYEIQILESLFLKLKTDPISDKTIILWIKHIRKKIQIYYLVLHQGIKKISLLKF